MFKLDKSAMVRAMKQSAGITSKDLAVALNTTRPYIDNKLHRNSWSLEDILVVAEVCKVDLLYSNGSLGFRDRNGKWEECMRYKK